MSKKKKLRIIVLIIIILSFKLTYDNYLSSEAYLKRITGIDFPFWTVTNQTASMEIAVVGKFQIPKSKTEEFVSKNKLNMVTDISDIKIRFDYILKEKNRPKKTNGKWFILEDCKLGNVWKILFNSESRDLWILVLFPDMAGDEPPCEKKQ